jgi:hypothetical protein
MWKEAIVSCFKVVFQHSPGQTEKITKKQMSFGRDSNPRSPQYDSKLLNTGTRRISLNIGLYIPR